MPIIPSDYFPVIRLKHSECAALPRVDRARQARLFPVLEAFVGACKDDSPLAPEEQRARAWESQRRRLDQMSRGLSRAFVDLHQYEGFNFRCGERDIWRDTKRVADARPGVLGPMLRLNASSDVLSRCELDRPSWSTLVALRLTVTDLEDTANLSRRVTEWQERIRKPASSIALVVDLADQPGHRTALQLLEALPILKEVKHWAWLAGSFPPSFGDKEEGDHWFPRAEWTSWWTEAASAASRVPAYGDYLMFSSIQPTDPQGRPSVSVRYTTDSQFFVRRGRQAHKSPIGLRQFTGHAVRLTRERREIFYGPGFSWGDAFIAAQAAPGKPATVDAWREATIVHHIEATLAQLTDPEGSAATKRRERALATENSAARSSRPTVQPLAAHTPDDRSASASPTGSPTRGEPLKL